MITVRAKGQDYDFELSTEPPSIYLDHWALRRLSEDSGLSRRFLFAFKHRATLMFSVMNAAEIARDASPQRAQQVRDFLKELGPHWFPMTIDPFRIINAEDTGKTPDGLAPCASVEFLTDSHFAARLATGPVSLAHVVDLTYGAGGDDLRKVTDRRTAQLQEELQAWRDEYAKNPKALDNKFPLLKFDATKPMRAIYNGLVRYAIRDTFTLNDNHARDLCHAMVSVRCAQMVTLDAHWAEQVRKLKLPPDFVQVYSEADLGRFLADLEDAPATR
ncbi:MAG: hypothetical protein ABSD47_01695 [Candidatus Methylomirabilota bacterium]|jgi:hypothetical protein